MITLRIIAKKNVEILMPVMNAILQAAMRWINVKCTDGPYEYVFPFLNMILRSGVLDLTNSDIQSFIADAITRTADMLEIIMDNITVGLETLRLLVDAMILINPGNPAITMRVLSCVLTVNQHAYQLEQDEAKKSDYYDVDTSDIHDCQEACGLVMISMFRGCPAIMNQAFPQILTSMQQSPSPIFMNLVWTGYITFVPGVGADVVQRVFGELYQWLAGSNFEVRYVALRCLGVILRHRSDMAGVIPEVMQKLCECLTSSGAFHVYIHKYAIPLVLGAIRLADGQTDITPLLQVFHIITTPREEFRISAYYPDQVIEDFCVLISNKKGFFAYMQKNTDRLAAVANALRALCENNRQRAALAQVIG